MKDELMQATFPQSANMKTANILIVGQISGGKSSFMNTVSTAFTNEVISSASTGVGNQSITKKVR